MSNIYIYIYNLRDFLSELPMQKANSVTNSKYHQRHVCNIHNAVISFQFK